MKLNKFTNLKQKIIFIPIIIVTLLSFIIPNYAQASVSDTSEAIVKNLIDIITYIPDSVIWGLQNYFIEETKFSDLFVRKSATEAFREDLETDETDPLWVRGLSGMFSGLSRIPVFGGLMATVAGEQAGNEIDIANIKYSLIDLFTNKVEALNPNFFKSYDDNKDHTKSIAYNLRGIIATWYITFRNIALVLMLIVLVFIGIKITISSVAGEKAKYKQSLMDWCIAIILIMFMHYIMVFSVNLTENFSNMMVGSQTQDTLLNISRTAAGLSIDEDSHTIGDALFWTLVYFVLVIYILIFTWQYLMRIIKLAFLTVIAPLIAFTYPIDKMMDGKSQGFEKWLKDYIFTLLMQPLHLILYSMLISSVSSLATSNPIYALVVLGAMIPMEKMLREYLGFGRANIKPPNPAGLLAAATVGSQAIRTLLPNKGNGQGSSGGNSGSPGGGNNQRPVDTRRGDNAYDLLAASQNRNNQNNNEGNQTNNEDNMLPQGDNTPTPGLSEEEMAEKDELQNYFDNTSNEDAYMNPGEYQQKLDRMQELEDKENQNNDLNTNNAPNNMQNEPDDADNKLADTKPTRTIRGVGNKIASSKVGKVGKGIVRGSGQVIGSFSRKLSDGQTGIRGLATAARKVTRVGAGITAAAAMGTAGLAYGIASGDVGKAVQLGAAGIAGGYAGGRAATNLAFNGAESVTSGARNTVDTFRSSYNPEAYEKTLEKRQIKEARRNIKQDQEMMRTFKSKYGKNMTDKEINQAIDDYTEQGLDFKEIQKGLDLEQKAGVDRETAMGTVKLSRDYDKGMLMDDKKTAKIHDSIVSNLQGQVPNADKTADRSIKLLKMAHGIEKMKKL